MMLNLFSGNANLENFVKTVSVFSIEELLTILFVINTYLVEGRYFEKMHVFHFFFNFCSLT